MSVFTGGLYGRLAQGRRRLFKSGPATKHQRPFTSAEGTS